MRRRLFKRTYKLDKFLRDEIIKFYETARPEWYDISSFRVYKTIIRVEYKLGNWQCEKCGIKLPTKYYRYCEKHDPVMDLLY